jgi:hypothetical protein
LPQLLFQKVIGLTNQANQGIGSDVWFLLTATGRLDHLIVGAAAATDPAVAESDRTIVNYLRHLIRFLGPEPPVSVDEAVG